MMRIRTRIRLPKRAAVLLACLLAGWPSDEAGAQTQGLNRYERTSWPARALVPTGHVYGFTQTPDGYLWMSTDSGLSRFDGVRARAWRPSSGPGLPRDDAYRLRTLRDGSIWIGTEEGLMILRAGRLAWHPAFRGQSVFHVYEDTDGVVWVGLRSPGRLCSVRGSAVACQGEGRLGDLVSRVMRDRRGALWVSTDEGLWRWAPGPPRFYPVSAAPRAVFVALDGEDSVLVSTHRGLQRMQNGELRPYTLPGLAGRFSGGPVFRARDGTLWVANAYLGLFVVSGGRTHRLSAPQDLLSNEVTSVFEDREGNIWVGTTGGVDKFRPVVAPRVSTREGLSSQGVTTVLATADGSVWMGTPMGLNRWRDGQVTVYAQPQGAAPGTGGLAPSPRADGAVQSPVYSLGEDGRGTLWASTPDGMMRYSGGRFVPVPGSHPGGAFGIASDTRGAVWLTYLQLGTDRWTPDGTLRRVHVADPGGRNSMTALAADPRRRGLWTFLQPHGLAFFDEEGRVRETYPTERHGIPGVTVDLRMGSDGAAWGATAGGLVRVRDGRVAVLGMRNGLPCEFIHWSMEDDEGSLWMRASCGLLRVPRAEVQAWARDPARRVAVRAYARHELPAEEIRPAPFQPPVTRAADGTIWFADRSGAGVIDPRTVRFDERPPPVLVERLVADGTTYEAEGAAGRRLRLPPRVRTLEVQFTALSYSMPDKVAFRWMLEGQDPAWREAVNQRRVEYSNLAPGTYRFRVMAANHDGVWNTAGASLTFTVARAWDQTWWFFALVAAAVAAVPALAAVAWQRRRARLAAERERARFEAMLAERTRVARELHDTLLGDMAGVAMQLSAVARRVESAGADAPVVEALSGLGGQVQRTLTEARASVTALRTAPETLPPLHERLADAARRTFDGTGIAARVEHTGSPPSLAPTVEAEILGMATEAMTNARKHADARTVTVTCDYGSRGLRIRVRDDGRGFDPAAASPAGHWGLIGMRERAAAIGATVDVTSAPGAGTEVALALPIGDGRRRGWSRFLGRGRGRPALHHHDPDAGGDAT